MSKILIIPVQGPLVEEEDDSLDHLQELVGGGNIEAVVLPKFLDPDGHATAYVNEEGKFREDCAPNRRATDLLVPGVGLFPNDYIAGPLVLVGFDPSTGEHTAEVPAAIVRRVRLIEREAG